MEWEPYLVALLDEQLIRSWRIQSEMLLSQLKSSLTLLKMLKNETITEHAVVQLGAVSGFCDKLINDAEDLKLEIEKTVKAF